MSYEDEYRALRDAAVPVEKTSELFKRFVAACQKNPWIKVGGVEFEPEGFCAEHDYPFYLERYDDVEMLKKFFLHGNWGPRTAVQHRDLIFVNQVNAGDEWWTLKVTPDDGELVPFESVSMRLVIKDGKFNSLIENMSRATVEQCRKLKYNEPR